MEAVVVILLFPLLVGFVIFLRAVSAKVVTGKWPHEDEESARLFRELD